MALFQFKCLHTASELMKYSYDNIVDNQATQLNVKYIEHTNSANKLLNKFDCCYDSHGSGCSGNNGDVFCLSRDGPGNLKLRGQLAHDDIPTEPKM